MNSEFSIQLNWATPHQASAARWILSHVMRHKIFILVLFVGAIGNAAGGALMSVYIGQAFNAVMARPIQYNLIGLAALSIIVSQVVRAILQLGCNFSA